MTTTIKFEPSRNEWFVLREVNGQTERIYLKVYWPDNIDEALLKWERILLILSDVPAHTAELPSGLHFADGLSEEEFCLP